MWCGWDIQLLTNSFMVDFHRWHSKNSTSTTPYTGRSSYLDRLKSCWKQLSCCSSNILQSTVIIFFKTPCEPIVNTVNRPIYLSSWQEAIHTAWAASSVAKWGGRLPLNWKCNEVFIEQRYQRNNSDSWSKIRTWKRYSNKKFAGIRLLITLQFCKPEKLLNLFSKPQNCLSSFYCVRAAKVGKDMRNQNNIQHTSKNCNYKSVQDRGPKATKFAKIIKPLPSDIMY